MSVTALYLPFKATMEPVARVGEYVAYFYRDRWVYFQIRNIEPLPVLIKNLGSVASNTKTDKVKIRELEVKDDELVQARILPLAPVRLYVYQPQGAPHYQTKEASFYLDGIALGNYSGSVEVYVYRDNVIYVEAENPLPVNLPKVAIGITGFKYIVVQPTERPERVVFLGGEPK